MSNFNPGKFHTWISENNRIRFSFLILFLLGLIDATIFPAPVATIFALLVYHFPVKIYKLILWSIAGIISGSGISYIAGSMIFANDAAGTYDIHGILAISRQFAGAESISVIIKWYSDWSHWILFAASFTPFPYGVFPLAAGALKTNPALFMAAVAGSHLLKFVIIAIALTSRNLKLRAHFKRLRLRSLVIFMRSVQNEVIHFRK